MGGGGSRSAGGEVPWVFYLALLSTSALVIRIQYCTNTGTAPNTGTLVHSRRRRSPLLLFLSEIIFNIQTLVHQSEIGNARSFHHMRAACEGACGEHLALKMRFKPTVEAIKEQYYQKYRNLGGNGVDSEDELVG